MIRGRFGIHWEGTRPQMPRTRNSTWTDVWVWYPTQWGETHLHCETKNACRVQITNYDVYHEESDIDALILDVSWDVGFWGRNMPSGQSGFHALPLSSLRMENPMKEPPIWDRLRFYDKDNQWEGGTLSWRDDTQSGSVATIVTQWIYVEVYEYTCTSVERCVGTNPNCFDPPRIVGTKMPSYSIVLLRNANKLQ